MKGGMVLWELYEKFDGQRGAMGLLEKYRMLEELRDPRTVAMAPTLAAPWFTVMVLAVYLAFVKWIGPRFMASRPPMKLRRVIMLYNTLQVSINAYLFVGAYKETYGKNYSFKCQPIDYSSSQQALEVHFYIFAYYAIKIFDLLDTIFFVLRKKTGHISFLHLYHHFFMVFYSCIGVNYFPGGHAVFLGVLNTFVHVIMYTYYLLAAMGPKIRPYLWWKKYLTTLQMVQFIVILLHASQLLFYDCGFPKIIPQFIMINAGLFFYLFYDFYQQSYKKKDA